MSLDISVFTSAALAGVNLVSGGYRPLLWATQSVYLKTSIEGYIFDAVLREEHVSSLRATSHPVQTGANITDHAYIMPASLILEVGMSDAMASFTTGQWGESSGGNLLSQVAGNVVRGVTGGILGELLGVGLGKHVLAYRKLLELQALRQPLKVVSHYRTYQTMLIERIIAPHDNRLNSTGRFTVYMQQILLAQVPTTTAQSSDANTTDTTAKGTTQAEAISEDRPSVLYNAWKSLGFGD